MSPDASTSPRRNRSVLTSDGVFGRFARGAEEFGVDRAGEPVAVLAWCPAHLHVEQVVQLGAGEAGESFAGLLPAEATLDAIGQGAAQVAADVFDALVEEALTELYGELFPKAVYVFERGIEDALTYLSFPGSHHARLRTTNVLERLFKEVKRRTRVVGVFPDETSASTLATEIVLRSSEEWALRRYLTMDALEATEKPNPQHPRH